MDVAAVDGAVATGFVDVAGLHTGAFPYEGMQTSGTAVVEVEVVPIFAEGAASGTHRAAFAR